MALNLGEFTDSTTQAAKLAMSSGIPFDDALRQINAEKTDAKRQEAIMRAQQQAAMEEAIQKMAKLGTEPRANMPQVADVQTVRQAENIPTGYLEFVDPKKLKPIQKGIDEKLLEELVKNWDEAGKKPILISKDNWIIDGLHRVKAAIKKNKWIRAIRINLPGKKALNAVKNLNK